MKVYRLNGKLRNEAEEFIKDKSNSVLIKMHIK
jgi:hypothetical protein